MKIEPARQADADMIAVMSRDLIEFGLSWRWRPQRVEQAISDVETTVIKAVADDLIRGFAIMRFGCDEAHLDLLAVHSGVRRRGVATALLHWLEETALVAGTSIVRLELRETNRGAMCFYRRMGYRHWRTVSGYYQGREAAVQMARDLWSDVPLNTA